MPELIYYPLRCPKCDGYVSKDYDNRPVCRKCNSRFVLVELEHAKSINQNLNWKALCIDLDVRP